MLKLIYIGKEEEWVSDDSAKTEDSIQNSYFE